MYFEISEIKLVKIELLLLKSLGALIPIQVLAIVGIEQHFPGRPACFQVSSLSQRLTSENKWEGIRKWPCCSMLLKLAIAACPIWSYPRLWCRENWGQSEVGLLSDSSYSCCWAGEVKWLSITCSNQYRCKSSLKVQLVLVWSSIKIEFKIYQWDFIVNKCAFTGVKVQQGILHLVKMLYIFG